MPQGLLKTGVVKAIQGRMAVVVTRNEPECEGCKAKDVCSSLGGTGANREVTARNTAEAQVGDVVKLRIRGSSLLKITFLVYMVPILALAVGALLGYLLAKSFNTHEDFLVGAFAGLGVMGSFLWIRKKGEQLCKKEQFIPEIISKAPPGANLPSGDMTCPAN